MDKYPIYPFICLFFFIGLAHSSANMKPPLFLFGKGDPANKSLSADIPTNENHEEWINSQKQVTSFDCDSVIDVDPEDCKILVRLYESSNGAGWTNNFNWLWSPIVDFWYGVTVEKYHVISLDLSSNALTGTIPADLGGLTSLLYLSLADNQLAGLIPASLGNLTNLWSLALSGNNFDGKIPPELGNLYNLERLYLNFNDFQGTLPVELGNLSNLQQLYLFANASLSGPIPQNFIYLTVLDKFWFYDTALCEPTTPEFQAWKATVSDWIGTFDCIYCYLPFLLR